MRGLGEGRFAPPAPVLDAEGERLRVGQFWDDEAGEWARSSDELGISATPVDWDADGDLDLLLGTQEGHVWLSRNEGGATAPSFSGDLEQLRAEGGPLEVAGRHAMPVVADWDGDGRWDLLSGSGAGGVTWFRNVGEEGAPRFAAEARLVPRASGEWEEPGRRTQVAACDFDADGDVDLLVGDYRSRPEAEGGNQREWHGWVWLYRRKAAPAGSGHANVR